MIAAECPDCQSNMLWPQAEPPAIESRGLGDTLEKVLSAVGIKKRHCGGCSRRQAKLNKLFPYRKRV